MKCTPQKTMNSASGCFATSPGEAERIADVVGELDDLVALVVMTEDDQPAAERRLRSRDAAIELFVGQTEIALGERLALRDVRLLELRQDRKHRRHLNY